MENLIGNSIGHGAIVNGVKLWPSAVATATTAPLGSRTVRLRLSILTITFDQEVRIVYLFRMVLAVYKLKTDAQLYRVFCRRQCPRPWNLERGIMG